jgi:hypothetical protein
MFRNKNDSLLNVGFCKLFTKEKYIIGSARRFLEGSHDDDVYFFVLIFASCLPQGNYII